MAAFVLRLLSLLVPRRGRREWLEEWEGELAALLREPGPGVPGRPHPLAFVAGALPHALWTLKQGWTMDGLLHDLRFSLRVLRRIPVFTAVAAVTLALGIGANASIFTLLNGLILRPHPGVEAPDRLVQLARSFRSDPRWDSFSWPAWEAIRSDADVFQGVAGWSDQGFILGTGVSVERVIGQVVTGSYFGVLGVQPALGRLLTPADDLVPGEHPVVVLSHGLWTRRYGADPGIVGRTVELGSVPYTVVGVAPAEFRGTETVGFSPALWVPAAMHPGWRGSLPFDDPGWSWLNIFARLPEDGTLEGAEAAMPSVAAILASQEGVDDDIEIRLAAGIGMDPVEREETLRLAAALAVIVLLVLLLTCTSVANLFVTRAAGRETEMAVRATLGAGRVRLMGLVGLESALLAGLATLLAVPAVLSADRIIPALVPLGFATRFDPDLRVWGFLVLVGAMTAVLFGAAPAWSVSRRAALEGLRRGASTQGGGPVRLRSALVTLQLALSLGLVTAAALLGKSVWNVRMADPGFRPAGIGAARVDLAATGRYGEEGLRDFFRTLEREAREDARFSQVTLASQLPLVGGQSRGTVRPALQTEVEYEAETTVAGPGYFELMGIPILRGRGFSPRDPEPERVVVVSEGLAALFWPGEDPVGKELDGDPHWRVVGVVPDVQLRSLRAPGLPAVYFPTAHTIQPGMLLIGRGAGGAMPPPAAFREAVGRVDPAVPVPTVVDVGSAVADSLAETRTIGWLVALFAGLALLLAVVGLYGLVAFTTARRSREFGIRMALGARPNELTRLVLAGGLPLLLLGLLLGGGVSWALGRILGGLLFGVGSFDPLAFGTSALLLVAVAGVAAWLPARRAGGSDVVTSLQD